MATINMHMKFEIEIPKQTWLMLRKPCRLQTDGRTDGQTDRRTDGRTRWIQYTPPPTSLGGGIIKLFFTALWPSDAIWRHRFGSTLTSVMACCLTAPSHYLNQCWPMFTNGALWQEVFMIDEKRGSKIRYYYNMVNYANPIYGVAIICHQVRCSHWGHPSLFHTATSLLIWYKMFCMRNISCRLIWMKFINMLSVYAQSGMHRRFNWWIIAVLT